MIGAWAETFTGLRLRLSLLCHPPRCSACRPRAGYAASGPPYPVGFKQIEFTDGDRHIALAMFYPAARSGQLLTPTGLPFFTNLHLHKDAGCARADIRW